MIYSQHLRHKQVILVVFKN